MSFSIKETNEAVQDVTDLAFYIVKQFKNNQAALDFLSQYDKAVSVLNSFPFGFRGIGIEHKGYEIRLKPFGTYNIFFMINMEENIIVVLRVLKNLQDWQNIIQFNNDYHY